MILLFAEGIIEIYLSWPDSGIMVIILSPIALFLPLIVEGEFRLHESG
jgi:hypothetical protein